MSSGSTHASGREAAELLIHLSKSDVDIHVLKSRIQEIEDGQRLGFQAIADHKAALAQAEALYNSSLAHQSEEEERLRSEQRKIVERRKHLSVLGGTRGAKLMEREIDISARTVQQMEQKILGMIEETERLKANVDTLRSELELKQLDAEANLPTIEQTIAECRTRLHGLEERRNASVNALDERVRGLYLRVSARYPGGAIAIAEGGACRSCYRALPAQTFNQVVAGNLLIQCPGCSRILVPAPVSGEEPA